MRRFCAAVLLTLVGLLMMRPILFGVRASFVGLYMLGGLLLTLSLTSYVIAMVQELRRGGAL